VDTYLAYPLHFRVVRRPPDGDQVEVLHLVHVLHVRGHVFAASATSALRRTPSKSRKMLRSKGLTFSYREAG
jgi:hypothetical protein